MTFVAQIGLFGPSALNPPPRIYSIFRSNQIPLILLIGGFLVLLLGASILTVCEIVDFILVAVAAAWETKKNREKVKGSGGEEVNK